MLLKTVLNAIILITYFKLKLFFCQEIKPSPIWNFHIARKILTSFEYRQRDVAIWEDKETESLPVSKRQFYVTPTAELIPASVKCEYRSLTNTFKVAYDIQLWNRHLDLAAIENLRMFNISVGSNQVHPLPFYMLRIVWDTLDPLKDAVLESKWISNLQQHYIHRFTISASTNESCQLLEDVLKNDPAQFVDSISLQYTLSASSTATKSIQITSEHIHRASLFSTLNNINVEGSIRYLRAKDMNLLVNDIVNNIVLSEVTSGDFVHDSDKLSLKDLVLQILDAQKSVTSNFSSQVWQSVYWNPDYARPDKVSSFLNKTVRHDGGQNKIVRKESEKDSGGFNLFESFGLNFAVDGSIETENFKQWLKKNELLVDIKGEKFLPKNVDLLRLNMAQLQSRTNIATKIVRINHVEAPGSLKVAIASFGDTLAEENNYLRNKLSLIEGQLHKTESDQMESKVKYQKMVTDQNEQMKTKYQKMMTDQNEDIKAKYQELTNATDTSMNKLNALSARLEALISVASTPVCDQTRRHWLQSNRPQVAATCNEVKRWW